MDGRTGFSRNNRTIKFNKSCNREEIVEIVPQRSKGTGYTE